MPAGKQTAYETDIHLPLLARGPGIAGGTHVAAITGNIDLAPTIAALGGATMTDNPDGRSLVPFLSGQPATNAVMVAAPGDWRQAYLLEHWNETPSAQDRADAAQLEPDDLDQGGVPPGGDASAATPAAATVRGIPEFQGIRIAGWTYIEYATGERELYDLVNDPDELNNIAKTANPGLIAVLHQRLDDLRQCAGDSCRSAESAPLSLP
jgi:arylsulfatase A-like enzyme